MATVLFVGAGRHQRRAIEQARARGLRVAAVDRNADAPGLAAADEAEVVDFTAVPEVLEVARRVGVDGVLTVSADRAVPVVAAVAEELGLPGIGTRTAHLLTHKRAMRDALGASGLPQPPYASLRSADDVDRALGAVPFPAVLKPVDSGGQRAVFRIESRDELVARSARRDRGVADRRGAARGVRRRDRAERHRDRPRTASRRRSRSPTGCARPESASASGWIHVYPPSIPPEQLRLAEQVAVDAVRALGLRDAIAFPQLIASPDGSVAVVEVAARIPGGQMADLVRHAVGVDLVEVALRQALGEDVPDEIALPRFTQPLAIRFFTAQPGPLPTGRVTRIGSLDAVLASEGVVQADTYLQLGETIRPVRRDGDRRGYVIAIADTPEEALSRAELAATRLDVEVEAGVAV